MPRRRRLLYPGAVYHVMARGNRKAAIFEDDTDRRTFLALLGETVVRYSVRVYGSCLMGNHYHLILDTPSGNLPDSMRLLNGAFAQASNRRHGRTGHLFEARYRSLVIQREGYLRRALRYVVLNPVRAHLVADACSWPWSSYRPTAGLEPAPPWLTLDWMAWVFDGEPGSSSQEAYRRYVNEPRTRPSVMDTTAIAFGGHTFRERMALALDDRRPGRPLPVGLRPVSRPELATLLDSAADDRFALAAAASTAHVKFGYRQSEIARHLKVHQSTISRLLRKWRESPAGST